MCPPTPTILTKTGALVLAGAALLMVPVTAAAVDTDGVTEQVNVSSAEEDGNGSAFDAHPSLSAGGRFVAFASDADNLVPDDTNGASDTFVRDRLAGTTERVSLTSNGREGEFGAGSGSISADGRYVAFASASDLVGGDPDPDSDVFVHDRLTGETTRVSVATDGTEPVAGRRRSARTDAMWRSCPTRSCSTRALSRAPTSSCTTGRPG